MVLHGTDGFVKTKADYDQLLKDNELVVVDFTASWCGPCKMIGPKFKEWAAEKTYEKILFVKVDVDESSEISEAEGISAMPTFKYFKGGKKVSEVVGANEAKIKENLDKLL